MTRDDPGREKSSKVDISGMVYDEQEIDAMIAKVEVYRKSRGDRTVRDLAEDIKYKRSNGTNISKFLNKNKLLSENSMLSILKKFQDFFAELEAAGEIFEPEHPLQILVNQLTRENEKLKKGVETLEYMVEQRDQKIAKLEKNLHESPAPSHLPGPSSSRTIYETPIRPVKPEVNSQQSQNTIETNMKEFHHEKLKIRIREAIADLQEQRRRRVCKTYLIVDANGKGKYAGKTIRELKARLSNHMSPNSQISSKALKEWISTQPNLTAYTIFEGSDEECALVESILINLGPELGFELLNKRTEKSRLETPTKYLELDDEDEISVLPETFPMKEEDEGHDQFVADVQYMIQNAMEQRPVRYGIHSRSLTGRVAMYGIHKRRSNNAANGDKSDEENEEPSKKRARKESESEAEDEKESESEADD